MVIIPAIDIKSGKCVRLYQGKFEQMTEYSGHPWEIAKAYAKSGAHELHIVDLDGAKEGEAVQLSRVAQICQLETLNIQIGGGIRSHRHIKILFADGASRVVIGSLAVTKPKQVKEWMQEFGADRIVLAFDISMDKKGEPIVVTDAWQTKGSQSLWELIDLYTDAELKHVLCTDISRDGTLQGPNFDLYEKCQQRYPNILFQASGGIGTLEDLVALKKLKMHGAIVGKALLEKRFTLEEALKKVGPC